MSLFNRPAWAKQQLSSDKDKDQPEANIFSHSHSYQDIVAEQEKRKKEKAEKKKAKAERRSSGKREVKEEPTGEITPKRRRITGEESEKLLKRVGLPARLELSDDEGPAMEHTPRRRSPRKQGNDTQAGKSSAPAAVIDLGGSSEEDNHIDSETMPEASRTQAAETVEEVQDESEDEFAELARKARQQRQQSNNRSSHTPGVASPSPGVGSVNDHNHDRPPDPVIQLFITSPLPGTNPLIVHRKLSQSIGAIRQAWCQKQAFSKEFADRVFFIHRMRRVYDVTTCRSLGLEADQFGNVTMRGAEGREGVEKVLVEAVTDEIFQQMKEQKDKDAQSKAGMPVIEEQEDAAEEAAQKESTIRVTLKAKGQADFKLKVKPVSPLPFDSCLIHSC